MSEFSEGTTTNVEPSEPITVESLEGILEALRREYDLPEYRYTPLEYLPKWPSVMVLRVDAWLSFLLGGE